MTPKKIASIVFATLVVLPFFVDVFAPLRPEDHWADESDFELGLCFWAHALPVVLICVTLIVMAKAISIPQKILWIAYVAVLWPVAAPSLMYRLYWYRPAQVPKTVEEQRQIIRAMADEIRARKRDA